MTKILLNGCFDLLHPGHIQLFEHCKLYPNRYVKVLVDSDNRIKDHKGPNRPIIAQNDRAYMIKNLKYVDEVVIFDNDAELLDLVKEYSPDIMIKGSEYKGKKIIGEEYCKDVILIDTYEKYSTSKIISYITNR